MKKPMNFREWWDAVGTDMVKMVCEEAGCSMNYVRQFRVGVKSPGKVTAMKLRDAARSMTPGWEPDLELMLLGVPPSGTGSLKIKPSKAFLAGKRLTRKR